jgi:hypothetical protein
MVPDYGAAAHQPEAAFWHEILVAATPCLLTGMLLLDSKNPHFTQ